MNPEEDAWGSRSAIQRPPRFLSPFSRPRGCPIAGTALALGGYGTNISRETDPDVPLMPVGGGTIVTMDAVLEPTMLAVDDASVYWSWGSGYAIAKVTPK